MKKLIVMLLLILTACSGTVDFNVVENPDGSYSGDFNVVLDETVTPLPPTAVPTVPLPTVEPTPVPPTPLPPTVDPEPTPTQEVSGMTLVTTNTLNYRTTPLLSSNSYITTLPTGTTLEAFTWYAGETFTWVGVEVAGQCPEIGWVADTGRLGNVDYSRLIETTEPFASTFCASASTLQEGFNYNANAIRDLDYTLKVAGEQCADGHLVMNGIYLADALYETLIDAGCDEPTIVVREFQPCEGDCYAVVPPEQFIDRWCDTIYYSDYPEHYYYEIINEPDTSPALLQWSVDASNYASTEPCGFNMRLAVPAWGVGRVRTSEVDAGLYDELGRTLHENGHALSVHNYFIGVPSSGWGQMAGQTLANVIITGDARTVRENYCPRNLTWDITAYDPSSPNTWYHMGREFRLMQRWYSLGYTNIPVMLTEFGADVLQDVVAIDGRGVKRPVNDILRDHYGYDFRGIMSYRDYYRQVFPNLSFAQALDMVIECAVEQYPAYDGQTTGYDMIALFSWTSAQDWVRAGFGFDGQTGIYAGDVRQYHGLTMDDN